MSPYRTTEDELLRALRERVESMLDPDAPHREPYPFASPDDIAAAESELGFPLPPLLRDVYGVANGGIGPGHGLYPIGEGEGTLVAMYRHFVAEGLITRRDAEPGQSDHETGLWPERLLPFCDWGCAIWSCLDCRSNDGPIVTSSNGRPLVSTGHTLRSWLSQWLSGTDLFEEMFEPGPVHNSINPFTKEPIVMKGTGKPKGTRWP
jgi:hypothetical protein